MAIHCPHCQHALGVKGAKPGRYTTKCPKCAEKILLAVPEDPAGVPVVSRLRPADEPDAKAPASGRTVSSPATAPALAKASGSAETVLVTTPESSPPPRKARPAAEKAAATVPEGATEFSGGPTAPGSSSPTAPTQPGPGASQAAQEVDTGVWTAPEASPTRAKGPGDGIGPSSAMGFEVATGMTDPVGDPAPFADGVPPKVLGGYQILKELGRGGMGAVYLAKQLSLERNVALKVMRSEWARNPTFVSRFTREAYAAAQLVHHNVVQIYDFGQDRGTNYFSMEFVKGQTLSDLLKTKKTLDVELAVGYVLQAARGLKAAHDQSMIHRDIKPDNLLVNEQGIVKVADLGLVKTPALAEAEEAKESSTPVVSSAGPSSAGGAITQVNIAMGTPAFMAPEQAKDAAGVDARADIYSLGCTLYQLITGRPPFEGRTAIELISKHQTEPVPPPETIVKRVPKSLSGIILKMVAKRPEDRYPDIGAVIQALEGFLGIVSNAPFSPREEHADLLGESVETFNASPTARLRPKLLLGGLAACVLVILACALARQAYLATGFLGLGLLTALAYFVIHGIAERTYLFTKVREYVFGSRPADWLMTIAGVALLVTLLVVFHLFWAWLAFGVVAVAVAYLFHTAVDRKVQAERLESIEKVQGMLRSMRLLGLDEETLRQFVSKYSGERWEEFYEVLFGYEAKIVARERWGRGEGGRLRPTFAPWRDPIVRGIDARQQARRAERERSLLQKIEEKNLEARGVNLVVARRQSQRAAEAMVAMAAELREQSRLPESVHGVRHRIGDALKEAAAKPEKVLVEREHGLLRRRDGGPLHMILGPRPRFLAGAALLAGCLFWLHQNDLLTRENIEQAAAKAKEAGLKIKERAEEAVEKKGVPTIARSDIDLASSLPEGKKPLTLPFLPASVTRRFHSINPGVAGLILLVSSFFAGTRMGFFAFPAAAIAFLGPSIAGPSSEVPCLLAGLGLGIAGLFFGRSRY